MTGCNHGKSDDELTRKDLFDVIEIYKKENTELKKQIEKGVVIAEGEVKNIVIGGFITYKIGGQYIDDLLKQFMGKKGKLIFIEDNK